MSLCLFVAALAALCHSGEATFSGKAEALKKSSGFTAAGYCCPNNDPCSSCSPDLKIATSASCDSSGGRWCKAAGCVIAAANENNKCGSAYESGLPKPGDFCNLDFDSCSNGCGGKWCGRIKFYEGGAKVDGKDEAGTAQPTESQKQKNDKDHAKAGKGAKHHKRPAKKTEPEEDEEEDEDEDEQPIETQKQKEEKDQAKAGKGAKHHKRPAKKTKPEEDEDKDEEEHDEEQDDESQQKKEQKGKASKNPKPSPKAEPEEAGEEEEDDEDQEDKTAHSQKEEDNQEDEDDDDDVDSSKPLSADHENRGDGSTARKTFPELEEAKRGDGDQGSEEAWEEAEEKAMKEVQGRYLAELPQEPFVVFP